MNSTAKLFLLWVIEKLKPIHKDKAREVARKYCRENWNRYGEDVVKKALYMTNTTTLTQFEIHCITIKKQNKKNDTH